MRSKDEIGRFSLRSTEEVDHEDLQDANEDDKEAYLVYLIGHQGFVRDDAEMVYDPDEEHAGVAWNGDIEWGDADSPDNAALQWLNDSLANGQAANEAEADEAEDEDAEEDEEQDEEENTEEEED